MDDLHERLTAAINARLEVARAVIAFEPYDATIGSASAALCNALAALLVANDPATVIRHCEADLAILAEVAGWRHLSCGDGWYSCSQATEEAGYPVDEACSDEDRTGRPCDCGRDRRRAAILHPLATAYSVEVDGA